ncbi:MAG: NAD(+) diphosphatase [Treponema sp.]|nr:NAD(+) diphosphatase [Treponema sp.]
MPFVSNPEKADSSTCFALRDKNLILRQDGSLLSFEDLLLLKKLSPDSEFFNDDSFSVAALNYPEPVSLPEGYVQKPIREFFSENTEDLNFRAARARSILEWRVMNRFCPYCGGSLQDSRTFSAKECAACGKVYFPRIEPCVIVLVHRGEQVLLVRHTYRNQNIFACIAGFMEAGESAENAVRREVFEETGLKVKNIKYKGSQGWPYPDQLMLAFTADYESGELVLQKEEIAEAIWCRPEECENSPKPGSIAYRLIHDQF